MAYPLNDVRACVRGGQVDFWVENSIEILVNKYDWSIDEAKRVIRETIEELVEGDFCSTIPSPPPPADVYATERFDSGFYIKFKLVAGRLTVCSFHPPTGPMRTKKGDTVR